MGEQGVGDAFDDRAFRDLVEAMRDVVIAFDADGLIGYVNHAGPELLGWPVEALVGRSVADFIHPDDLERALEVITLATDTSGDWPLTPAIYRVRRGDGSYVPIEFFSPPAGISGLGHLVTVGRWSGDQPLQRQVLETLTAGRPPSDALAIVPEFGRWRHPSERYSLVVESPEGGRQRFGDTLPAGLDGLDDEPGTPFALARATGTDVMLDAGDLPDAIADAARRSRLGGCWVVPVADPMGLGPALLVAWSSADGPPLTVHRWPLQLMAEVSTLVLQWRKHLYDLQRAALHDALTGAANRARFFAELADRRPHPVTAVLYVDLDGFKQVNDRLGHHAGDQVLVEVTRRIEAAVRPDDLVARLGGDEFAVLCGQVRRPEDATDIAGRIVEAVAEPMVIAGSRVQVGASVGVAVTDEPPGEWLLDRADRALYDVKKQGKGAWRLADGA